MAAIPVRPASTVMLVRDGATGLEVFTLQRVAQMAFAAGMTVFPGGGVDESDHDPEIPWAGPDPPWWAENWHLDDAAAARAQVVAAVRELYEETGVLLASRDRGSGAGARPGAARASHPDRAAIAGHRLSLAAALRACEMQLRADLLRPWARWITPPGPPRRYDTYFFLAALPGGQTADAETSEAAAGGWQRPADVLLAGERGVVGLMPPTIAMLTDLAAAGSVGELMAAERAVEPVTPQVLSADGEVLRVRAAGREYRSLPGRVAASRHT